MKTNALKGMKDILPAEQKLRDYVQGKILETYRASGFERISTPMLEDAENKARQLVEEENIVRRARVECDELRESARQEASELHKNTLDYIDSLLAETDRKLSELINNIRLERNEIRNHR